ARAAGGPPPARSRSAGRDAVAPAVVTTTAVTSSPHSGSGTPTTHTSATSAASARADSTAAGCTFTPPVTITSSIRPVTVSTPSARLPASPVTSHRWPDSSTNGCGLSSRYPTASIGPASSTRPSAAMRTCAPGNGTPSYTHPPQVSVIP